MAKNRNKTKNQKKEGVVSMDISTEGAAHGPQAMDTSEGKPSNPGRGAIDRKIKKAPVKRSTKLRKLKAVAKAIAASEKSEEKSSKNKNKMLRVQSAKSLYD